MGYSYRSRPGGIGSRSRHPQRTKRPADQRIDAARFIKAAKPVKAEDYTPANTFQDFKAHKLIIDNLTAKGYKTPTPIQDKTIPIGLEGKDVIGVANTGTGKTAAFAVPMLHKLMEDRNSRALIIAPVRELAQQIEDECKSIARGSGLNGALLIGGSSMGKQLDDLRRNPRIVIGTPGRIKDHMQQGSLKLGSFNLIVLDEVDRMLDMGFINDVRYILNDLSTERQSFFFSATIDGRVSDLIKTFGNDPVTISVKYGETSDNVEQNIIRFGSKDEKIDKLHDILIQEGSVKAIVFHESKYGAERLGKELERRGFKADSIHGGKSQGQRMRALKRFKDSEITILVATDVAARGIDVADITHVINFSAPKSYEDYAHRIGRAGRAGKTGTALTFVSNDHQ